jgi:hypothetical protein
VVEEKTSYCVSSVIQGRNGFIPFGKVIECHDHVLVPISRWRVASHEVYAPFAKGVGSDEGM